MAPWEHEIKLSMIGDDEEGRARNDGVEISA